MMPILLALLFTLPTHADRVGQGAGISENNIFYAYEYVDRFLSLCLADSNCLEDDEQRETAGKILAALPAEQKSVAQIQFRPQRNDGFFIVDGQMRAAKTFDYIGAPIYFNLNQIYGPNEAGVIVGISLERAIALLVHELGHHQGVKDHDKLDILGHRVGHSVQGRMTDNMFLNPERANISAASIFYDEHTPGRPSTQVFISDGPNLYDLGDQIFASFRCLQVNNQPTKLVSLALWNFSWRQTTTLTPTLFGFAEPYCQIEGSTDLVPQRGFCVEVGVGLAWSAELQQWNLIPNYQRIAQVSCAQAWDTAKSEQKPKTGEQP